MTTRRKSWAGLPRQQVVMFGRYEAGGEARVTLKARLTGESDLPDDVSVSRRRYRNPEVERLWARQIK